MYKNTNTISYKGFIGSVEIRLETNILWGKVLDIPDSITYQGTTVLEIKKDFEDQIDDFIAVCQEFDRPLPLSDPNAKRGKSKQVIVMRTDLGMRKGKMIAQGAHASLKVMLDFEGTAAMQDWLQGQFTKICVKGESEDHIKDLYKKAQALRIPCSLILDAGLTEFKEPTYTCIAIGPGWAEDIDKITGGLSLL
jgi:PTH2 family peptidyl-tRNA hydrolase